MRRRVVVLLMLFTLLWQSVAHARMGSSVDVVGDLAHAVLHWSHEAHHHHDDGSFHVDDSKESAQHVLSDNVNASLATATAAPRDFGSPGASGPGALRLARAPNPTLDGLLRPPRLFS